MTMSPVKTVILNCTEAVYPQDWLDRRVKEFTNALRTCPTLDIYAALDLRDETSSKAAGMFLETAAADLILVNMASWHITPYVISAIRKHTATPLLVYSMGGRYDETGKLHSPAGPAGLTALTPALRDFGFRFKVIYEEPGSDVKSAEIEAFAQVVAARKKVLNSRIGLIGYANMGLYTCAYDKTHVQKKLGVEIEDYFSYEIGKRMDEESDEKIAALCREIRETVTFTNDVDDETLGRTLRLYSVMKEKAKERDLAAISIKCVCGVTEHMGIKPCMVQSLLANKDLSVICECDALGLVTNVIMSAVTGQTSVFMENYEFLSKEVLVGICGFLPKDFVDGEFKFKASKLGSFFLGISCVSAAKTGPITFGRLFRKGDGYAMFLSRAEARKPMKWTELGWEEPTPDFPSLLIEPEMPISHYVDLCPGQHIILVQGDHYEKISQLCRLMDIEVVS